jgi:glutathione S-transferase
MTDFIVHLIPGSPFSRAALATLVEKSAGFRVAPVDAGGLRRPEHLARHPFGRVPVLEHGGTTIYETQAILRYLDRVLPEPPLTPGEPAAAARMDQAMNLCDWYLFHDAGAVVSFERLVAPMLLGQAPDEAAIAAAVPATRHAVEVLERELGDGPFLAGPAPSLADLMIAPQLDFLSLTPEWAAISADRGEILAWLDRMRARPSMAETTYEKVVERLAA